MVAVIYLPIISVVAQEGFEPPFPLLRGILAVRRPGLIQNSPDEWNRTIVSGLSDLCSTIELHPETLTVASTGLEPARPFGHQSLNLACIPFHHEASY